MRTKLPQEEYEDENCSCNRRSSAQICLHDFIAGANSMDLFQMVEMTLVGRGEVVKVWTDALNAAVFR